MLQRSPWKWNNERYSFLEKNRPLQWLLLVSRFSVLAVLRSLNLNDDLEFEVSTECDVYDPRSPAMGRRTLSAYSINTEREIHKVIPHEPKVDEKQPLVVENRYDRKATLLRVLWEFAITILIMCQFSLNF